MKRAFVTIFSLFYLLSGIGFASVQHYCQSMQTMMQGNENECCCKTSAATCPVGEKPARLSCCGDSETAASDNSIEMKFHGDCCDVQHSYNQLDISPLPVSTDGIQLIKEPVAELFVRLEKEHNFYDLESHNLSDPSTHLNLPLLI